MSTSENAPKVPYVRLGKSGLRVSVPIVGAMSFGDERWGVEPGEKGWVKNEPEALELLQAAWDRGVSTIDTANVYSNGVSEKIIGKFLKKVPRNKILIFTKCNGVVHDTDPGLRTMKYPELRDSRDYVNQFGLSRQSIFNAVNASLARLDTPYVDLLQIHRHDPNVPAEETMKALHDLVQSGKVRYIGASSMRTWQFAEYQHAAEKHGWTKFISMQNEYSLLYREEEREMIPYCNAHGVGLIPWGPLDAGNLSYPIETKTDRRGKGRQYSEADKEIIKRVEEVAKKKGWTMSEVALAWVSKRVSSPIVGMSSPARLEASIIPGKVLTEEEEKYLEEPYVPKAVRNHL